MKKQTGIHKLISIILIVCMTISLFPVLSSAAVTYRTNNTGDAKFDISNKNSTATLTYEFGKDGVGGKKADDKVYYYSSPDADTGYGYFSTKSTYEEAVHDADSSVVEFSFLLEDESSAFYFSPAFYNETGYDYFLKNGKLTNTSGNGYFKSHNDFIRFSSKGIYVKKTDTNDYIDSKYRDKYLSNEPISVGQWHTVAIKLPGLINSKGEPKKGADGAVIENAYAGGTEVMVSVDGTEYTIPLNREVYGTRHIKLHGRGGMYLDNINMYMTSALASHADYKNITVLPQITMEGNGAKLNEGGISYSGDITVSQLKGMIKGADDVRIYTDSSCVTPASDSDMIKSGYMVVVPAKNGDSIERSFGYYGISEQQPLEISGVALTDAQGQEITGTKLPSAITLPECYLKTTISNNTSVAAKPIRAVVASYDEDGAMVYYKSKEIVVQPGKMNISVSDNVHRFENIPITEKGQLRAFLLFAETGEPLCEKFETSYGSSNEIHILSFGNSYTNDSFSFLSKIAKADGIDVYAVNMYIGGCPISTHYSRMKGNGTYDKRYEYFPDGTTKSTDDVSFEDGLKTPGYAWDYITLHQKGQYSPFYKNYYTESNPYITELADYIRKNSPSGELLFFENWPVYTDRVTEKYSVYESIVKGHEPDEYMDLVFGEIKSCYIKAAAQIGNPGRIIPAGEAVYRAVTKYGFTEYVDNGSYEADDNFVSSARAMFRDKSSHLTSPYGKVLAGLTWYEYLTGNDARNNKYTNSKIPDDDMKLLKEIAHEVCSLPEYNPESR